MIVFPESPAHLNGLGREPRVCALNRTPVSPPYMVVLLDPKDGDDFYVDGSAITHENVLGHVKRACARSGAWKRLRVVDHHVIADLLALASAEHGGLTQQTVIGQQQRAKELQGRAPRKKKGAPAHDTYGPMSDAQGERLRRLDLLIATVESFRG